MKPFPASPATYWQAVPQYISREAGLSRIFPSVPRLFFGKIWPHNVYYLP